MTGIHLASHIPTARWCYISSGGDRPVEAAMFLLVLRLLVVHRLEEKDLNEGKVNLALKKSPIVVP